MTNLLIGIDGRLYCPMSGHADRDCPGYPSEEHSALSKAGIGWSSVPGPSDTELREELMADTELIRDEYAGVWRD